METGTCKHGTFKLIDGCKECIEERRAAGVRPEQDELEEGLNSEGLTLAHSLVKVQYYSEKTGELSPREYTYFSEERLAAGDVLMVPVRDTTGKAKVSAIDVPEEEIASFRDKVKTIPAGSKVPVDAAQIAEAGKAVDIIEAQERKAEVEFIPLKHTGAEMEMIEARNDIQQALIVGHAEHDVEEGGHVSLQCPMEIPDMTEQVETTAIIKIAPGKDESVQKLLAEVMLLKEYADNLVILTEDDAKKVTNDLKIMSQLNKAVDDKRKEYVGPPNAYVDGINADFKLLSVPLAEANRVAREKWTAFKLEQERRAQEAEEVNRQAMEVARKQAELNHGEFTVEITPVEVPAAPKITRADLVSGSLRDNWKYRIVDINLIPREYMMPDDAMLKSTAKTHHDKKAVAGVEFYNDRGAMIR